MCRIVLMKWGILIGAICIGLVIFFLSSSESIDDSEATTTSVVETRKFPIDENESANDPFTEPDSNADITITESKPDSKGSLAKLDSEEAPPNIPLTEEEMEELEEYFEKIEEDWGETLEQLFKQELQLTKETIEQYDDLREGFEEEKLAAFQEYHEQMVAKHGDNYAYRPSLDEKIFEKKVLDEYYDRLRKILGDDAYSRYSEVRERFNERIKSEQDPSKGILIIDF